MVDILGQGHKLILEKRRWDDYASMKQYFQNSDTKEVLFAGTQLLTTTFATMDGGHGVLSLTRLGTAAVAYVATVADDTNQDDAYVDIIYQDNTGAIQPVVRTQLDPDDPNNPVCIGHTVSDTCSARGANTITMTATAATVDQFAGWYVLGRSGNGNILGKANLIVSNTAHATIPILTVTDATDAGVETDILQIQEFAYDDFYRVREMYCEVETIDTKEILVLDDYAVTNKMAQIGIGHRYMADSGIFTQPTATCDTYLGRIKGSTGIDTTVTEVKSASIQVFYTPFEAHADGGAVETVIEIPFQTNVCWEPCIKLAPATDVTIRVKYTAGAAIDNIFVETSYLEVYK